jgi:hypothetical protein
MGEKVRTAKKLLYSTFFLAIMGLLFVTGCLTPLSEHFSGGGVSFNYPSSWRVSTPGNQSAIATISDPEETSISVIVAKQNAQAGYSAQQIQDNLVNAMSPTRIVTATSACSIIGTPAYETYFISQDLEVRLTSVLSGGLVYTITSSAIPDVFIKNQTNFDIVVNSFQIQ